MQQLNLFGEPNEAPKPKMIKDKRLTHYAVIEPGVAVWGTGDDQVAAIADAVHWCKEFQGIDINDAEDMAEAIDIGEMVVVACSRRLRKEVELSGGEIDFALIEGVGAYLPSERINTQ